MKKAVFIIAAILIVAGVALLVVAAVNANANGFSIKELTRTAPRTNTYTPEGECSKIDIITKENDVEFKPSEDGRLRVICRDRTNAEHTVSLVDGTLKIRIEDARKWYERLIPSFISELSITVYLPGEHYGALAVNSSTGDVTVPAAFSFDSIELKTSTGDINCAASATGALKMNASTGKITLSDLSAASLELAVSTGGVKLSSAAFTGSVSITVSTGDAYLTDVTCGTLSSHGSTGDISLTRVVVGGALSIERSTGDIRFSASDAAELAVKTSTGSISGSLLTGKQFVAKSNTGRVKVPDSSAGGGKCEFTTSTGNITIEIKAG